MINISRRTETENRLSQHYNLCLSSVHNRYSFSNEEMAQLVCWWKIVFLILFHIISFHENAVQQYLCSACSMYLGKEISSMFYNVNRFRNFRLYYLYVNFPIKRAINIDIKILCFYNSIKLRACYFHIKIMALVLQAFVLLLGGN